MRMTSNLGDTTARSAAPKGMYTLSVKKMERGLTNKTKAPKKELTWVIEEGEYQGTEIPYYTVVTGGLTESGDPMPLFGLIEFINATKIPWTCLECNSGDRVADIILGTGVDLSKGENGLEKGKYHCPDCKVPPRIDFDDDYMVGARCKADVTQEIPEGRERPVNRIKRLYPL